MVLHQKENEPKATAEEIERKAHTITYVEDPEYETVASDTWTDMPSYQPKPEVNTKYATQKPDELLLRLIGCGSKEGDLVADFFSDLCSRLRWLNI